MNTGGNTKELVELSCKEADNQRLNRTAAPAISRGR